MDRKWWTLIAVCFGTFMLLLDITVVNVALPDIQVALHSTFADLQWVVDAYALTLAAFLLTAGVLGDMYGRRGMFAIGLVLFSAGVAHLRPGHHVADAQPVPGRPGRRRGHHVRHLARPHRPGLRRQGAGHGHRRLRRRGRRGRRRRAAGRRGHHHGDRLAVDLLHQHPHRRGRRHHHPDQGGERPDPDRAPDRLARLRDLHLVAVPARLRPGPGQLQGLGQHLHRVDAGGRRPC